MVDKELIEIWRNMLKPAISSKLLKTNYEGMGEQDKEEFERDLDEILDLALIGLKYGAKPPQESTEKHTETHTCDLISRQAAIDAAALSAAEWDGMYVQDINGRIRKALEQLPPAQPDVPDTNVGDIDKFIDGIQEAMKDFPKLRGEQDDSI